MAREREEVVVMVAEAVSARWNKVTLVDRCRSGVSQECKMVILAPTVVWGDDRSYTAATCR